MAAQERLTRLELLSNTMLDRIASSGIRIDDTVFIERAQRATRELTAMLEAAITRGDISAEAVFDTDYRLMPGTNPPQYSTRFCDYADAHVRPFLDKVAAEDPRHIACVMSDISGYLPTHVTERSQPQRPDDPNWNTDHCRNRRNMIDDTTQRAIDSDAEAMLVTYRMDLSEGRWLPVKNVFVPIVLHGRRWGNFELAYRDEAMR
jgi:methyl-accepting chemotaxis protein